MEPARKSMKRFIDFLCLLLASEDSPATTNFLQGTIQKHTEILPKWAPRGVPEWSWRGPWGLPEAPERVQGLSEALGHKILRNFRFSEFFVGAIGGPKWPLEKNQKIKSFVKYCFLTPLKAPRHVLEPLGPPKDPSRTTLGRLWEPILGGFRYIFE